VQLAMVAARGGDYAGAWAALKPRLASADGTIRACAMEIALLRRARRKDDALRQLAIRYSEDPANSMVRFERTLLGSDDPELWIHLAADAERVLALVEDYVSMGMYEDALRLLEYSYPPLPPEQLEPGAVAPAKSPTVAYYRAYCREQLHQSAGSDLAEASKLSTLYAFPHLPNSGPVLRYALKSNPSDATAHFLLGLYLMHSVRVEEAVAEWSKARSLNPNLRGLDAELSRAMQGVSKDVKAANAAVKEVLTRRERPAAPRNTHRASISATAANVPRPGPAAATAPAPPSQQLPPQGLVALASSAMVRSSSENAGSAFSAFDPRLFTAEKQPETVRRAYIEVQLQKLLVNSLFLERCAAVLNGIDALGEEDKSLPFTFHGFGGYMKAAHFQYYLGIVEANCQQMKSARRRWTKVSRMKESLPSAEFVFPLLAAARSGSADAQAKAAAGLEAVRTTQAADASSRLSLVYLEGILLHITGNDAEASRKLQEVVRSEGDPTLQYLAQLGLRELLRR
jgi:tetratricopeptide (TPR) repeat protein